MPLSEAQRSFATSRGPFPCFVGGFGSGKTAAAIARAMALKAHFRQCDIAYYLPTFPLVEDIAFRRFPELCERKGWQYTLNRQSSYIEFPGAGRIVFRTMERPQRIVGYEVAHSICDELDTLPTDKARDVWNRVIARNRQKCSMANTVAVATTPEGYRFTWERWVKNKAPGYVLFKARTMDNAANLPDGYIDNLRNTYPEALLSAYLDGEFTNLTSGSVYASFDRTKCATFETIAPDEPLHCGLDFNVGQMACVVTVRREGKLLALDEFTGVFDTPAMIAHIKNRYPGRRVYVYPDASGNARKTTDASVSDLALLRQAGFVVLANPANPAIRDRVLAVNRALESGDLKVNPDRCPSLTESLEKQAFDKHGAPEKSGGLDHASDACGYVTSYLFPVVRQSAARLQVIGL